MQFRDELTRNLFRLKAGRFVVIYRVIYDANMQPDGCTTCVIDQKVNEDASTKDWDGRIVSTVWNKEI